ncbi:MAG TPA: DNA mismatch repair endonuclease MutL, partial [Verrucomicrobiae bacterium]|nr:DNA mismatch repair endonuclease MutL [Verrucomicrobiae bacterium]
MNRIKLLPELVANQIAAGEVIERPASVVKELVENALDADAKKISVEIGAGGRSLIRVTDDGIGMSRDDALLCLERHATSKIQRAEDLAAIATLGFRGEALPSIASVSRFTLITRERGGDSPEGTQVVVHGGTIVEVKAAGAPPGTSVEVRQLFYNLPARRKFLRAEETEAAHIQHYLTLAALAFPEVAFTFHKDGRLVWQLPPQNSGAAVSSRIEALRGRFRALLGQEKLLPVNFSAPWDDDFAPEENEISFEAAVPEKPGAGQTPPSSLIRIWGLIGAPGVSRSTRESQFLFVNRRPVENRAVNYALIEGYHTSLMKGRYPVCCLFLELDPAAVDVNVHPAKREVKFRHEWAVRKSVTQAVRETLLAFAEVPGQGSTARLETGARAPHAPTPSQPVPLPAATPSLPGLPGPPALTARPEIATSNPPGAVPQTLASEGKTQDGQFKTPEAAAVS